MLGTDELIRYLDLYELELDPQFDGLIGNVVGGECRGSLMCSQVVMTENRGLPLSTQQTDIGAPPKPWTSWTRS